MNYSSLLLLLMVAGATSGEVQKRVIGGQNCGDREALHHVVLTVKDKDGKPDVQNFHCGGSLIGAQWILTVAHCNKPEKKNSWQAAVRTFTEPTKMRTEAECKNLVALLNRHPNKANQQVGEFSLRLQYGTPHKAEPHDLLLLKLIQPVPTLPTVQLPPLNCRAPPVTTRVMFNGWFTAPVDEGSGKKGNSVRTLKLKCGNLEIADCGNMAGFRNDRNPYIRSLSYSFLLCAKDSDQMVDGCKGDSGGSLTTTEGVLHGVLTGVSENFCDLPVLFMDVCRYRDWIRKETKL